DSAQRLTSLQHQDGSGAVLASYASSYDAADRLTSESVDGVTTSYAYDQANELTQAGNATYGYDATGHRTNAGYQTGAGNDGANRLQMRRLYLDGPNQVVARVDSGGTAAWYLPDRQGSVRDVVSFAGTAVLDRVTYDGFGNVTAETNAAAGDAYKYNGGRLD